MKKEGRSSVFPILFPSLYLSYTYFISSPREVSDSNMFFHLAKGNVVTDILEETADSIVSRRDVGMFGKNYWA